MEFLDQIDLSAITSFVERFDVATLGTQIAAFEVPLPDAAILALFVVLLLAFHRSHRATVRKERQHLEAAYAAELATAHRRIYQVRGDLSRAQTEIEHERQNKRRAQRKSVRRAFPATERKISKIHEFQGANSSWG